jgi:hypothetical protein
MPAREPFDRRRPEEAHRDPTPPSIFQIAKLVEDLDAPDSITSAPTHARAKLCRLDTTLPYRKLVVTNREITIVNSNPNVRRASGRHCFVILVNGIWRVVDGGDGAIIVEAEIVEFDFDSNVAVCRVWWKTCGGTIPENARNYDRTIDVYDLLGCVFDETDPDDGYLGRHLAATLMERDDDGFVDTDDDSDDIYDDGSCKWMAIAFCCRTSTS